MYVDKLRVRKVGIEAIHDTFYGYIACHSVTTASLHVLVDDAAEWNQFCITTGRSMSGGGESLDVRRGAPQSSSASSSSTPPCLDLTLFISISLSTKTKAARSPPAPPAHGRSTDNTYNKQITARIAMLLTHFHLLTHLFTHSHLNHPRHKII